MLKQPIELNSLALGQPFIGDIVDASDNIVFRRGLKLTKDILKLWERRGSTPVFMMMSASDGFSRLPRKIIPAHLAFDADHLHATQAWFTDVGTELDLLVTSFSGEDSVTVRPVEDLVEQCLKLIQTDASVVIYECLSSSPTSTAPTAPNSDSTINPINKSLIRRSSALSALSCVIATELGLSHEECLKVGLAGLLHDLALYPAILARLQDAFDRPEEKQAVIIRHAQFATDLLTARGGVQDLVRIIINQVHEQMDGSGYPRGMLGHLINSLARIINIADAFLTLIAAHSTQPGFVASDAIPFMLHHTSRGVFDCNVMRAFLRCLTIYGIGTTVVLDDERDAVVLRSSPQNPLQPQVVIADDTQPHGVLMLDLESAGVSITGPSRDHRHSNRGRLPRSKMDNLLWQEMHLANHRS